MFSHAHDALFGDHLVLVTTARWRTHACCKITVSQPWRKYSCVAFFEAAGAKFCDNATAWTALIKGPAFLKYIGLNSILAFSYEDPWNSMVFQASITQRLKGNPGIFLALFLESLLHFAMALLGYSH